MKKFLWELGFAILLVGVCTIMEYYHLATKYKELYSNAVLNIEAYQSSNDSLMNVNRQFVYTINSLEKSKDSIDLKLLQTVKELNIKNKNLKQLQYLKNTISKVDTIKIVGDTIFRDIEPIDTTVSDKWYNLNLLLLFPSTIVVYPTFISELYVVTHYKKEFVNKPSKWFFIRWFQKKHAVVEIDILERNPYIKSKEFKLVEVIK